MQKLPYSKLALMLLISFVLMYGVMFLNVDEIDHVYLSFTRSYMSILMTCPMAILMLLMMGGMYPNKRMNRVIQGSALVIFVVSLAAAQPGLYR